jgi:pimeloyl-ACP methyl ester carboxylesterase
MNLLFSPPSLDDLIRLLKAWRFWVLGALIGAMFGAAIYVIVPPPYRARATVLVDFNLEQAWPQETDRQQFYYLERDARKLEEIAWSDTVMQAAAEGVEDTTVRELRERKLQLSQPAEGGWHFYADDAAPARAQALASAWAQTFTEAAQENITDSGGLNSFIEVTVTQAAELPVARSLPISAYLLAGALTAWFLSAFTFLFFDIDQPRSSTTRTQRKQSRANQQKSKSANRNSKIVNRPMPSAFHLLHT